MHILPPSLASIATLHPYPQLVHLHLQIRHPHANSHPIPHFSMWNCCSVLSRHSLYQAQGISVCFPWRWTTAYLRIYVYLCCVILRRCSFRRGGGHFSLPCLPATSTYALFHICFHTCLCLSLVADLQCVCVCLCVCVCAKKSRYLHAARTKLASVYLIEYQPIETLRFSLLHTIFLESPK